MLLCRQSVVGFGMVNDNLIVPWEYKTYELSFAIAKNHIYSKVFRLVTINDSAQKVAVLLNVGTLQGPNECHTSNGEVPRKRRSSSTQVAASAAQVR